MESDSYSDYEIVTAVFDKLTKKSYGISRARILDCIQHFDQTVDDYGIDDDSLFKNLSGWKINSKDIKAAELTSRTIQAASRVDNKLSQAIHEACNGYYNSLSQDEWKEHILKKDDTYRIWKLYHPKKYQANFDALKAVMKDYASGGATVSQPDKALTDEWLNICLEVKHSVKGLFTEVSNILKRDSMINKQKLLFFGGYILAYTDLEKQKDFVQELIPTEIVDADVIGFVAEHIDTLKNCEVSDEFKEKVKHLAETSMKGDEKIGEVCEKLGIEVEKEEGNSN